MEELPPLNFPAKSLEEASDAIPEDLLPAAARQRLLDARIEAETIKIRTLAGIESRYRSEPNPGGVSFTEYMTRGQAAIELDEMRMKISLSVLRVAIDEFKAVGKSGKEIRQIMVDELIVAKHCYELTAIQQHAIWWELGLYSSNFVEWIDDREDPEGRPSDSSMPESKMVAPNPDAKSFVEGQQARSNRRKAVVEAILTKKGWSIHAWVNLSKDVDYKTAHNYLSGKTKSLRPPSRVQLAASLGLEPKDLPE